jgi:hypothetical protein
MKIKSLLQVYALLVCLITVIILIISSATFLDAVTDYFIPQYKISYRGDIDIERSIKELRLNSPTSMLKALQWLFISLIFFVFHWRLYKKASSTEKEPC